MQRNTHNRRDVENVTENKAVRQQRTRNSKIKTSRKSPVGSNVSDVYHCAGWRRNCTTTQIENRGIYYQFRVLTSNLANDTAGN